MRRLLTSHWGCAREVASSWKTLLRAADRSSVALTRPTSGVSWPVTSWRKPFGPTRTWLALFSLICFLSIIYFLVQDRSYIVRILGFVRLFDYSRCSPTGLPRSCESRGHVCFAHHYISNTRYGSWGHCSYSINICLNEEMRGLHSHYRSRNTAPSFFHSFSKHLLNVSLWARHCHRYCGHMVNDLRHSPFP